MNVQSNSNFQDMNEYFRKQIQKYGSEEALIEAASKTPFSLIDLFRKVVFGNITTVSSDFKDKIKNKIKYLSEQNALNASCTNLFNRIANLNEFAIKNPERYAKLKLRLNEISLNLNNENLFDYLELISFLISSTHKKTALEYIQNYYKVDIDFEVVVPKNRTIIVIQNELLLESVASFLLDALKNLKMPILVNPKNCDYHLSKEARRKLLTTLFEKDSITALRLSSGIIFEDETYLDEFFQKYLDQMTKCSELSDMYTILTESEGSSLPLNPIEVKFLKLIVDKLKIFHNRNLHIRAQKVWVYRIKNLISRYDFFCKDRSSFQQLMCSFLKYKKRELKSDIYEYLKNSYELYYEDHVFKILEHIKKITGIDFEYENRRLNLIISHLNKECEIKTFEQLGNHLVEISKIFKENFKIQLYLGNQSDDLSFSDDQDFEKLLSKVGSFVEIFSISRKDLLLNFLNAVSRHCPNIEALIIDLVDLKEDLIPFPKSLKSISLINISDIDHVLKAIPEEVGDLSFYNCNKIEELRKLPKGLMTLKIEGCKKLQSINHLPNCLSVIQINDCPLFQEIPETLPKTLEVLEFSKCPQISKETKFTCFESLFRQNKIQAIKISGDLFFNGPEESNDEIYEFLKEIFKTEFYDHLIYFKTYFEVFVYDQLVNYLLVHHFNETILHFSPIDFEEKVKQHIKNEPLYLQASSYNYNDKTTTKENIVVDTVLQDKTIELTRLLDLFQQINFKQTELPDYIDLKKFPDDDGSLYCEEDLINGIKNLLDRIQHKTHFTGVPKDDLERSHWYKRLTDLLGSLITLSESKIEFQKRMVSIELVHIAIASYHCGERWLGDIRDAIESLKDQHLTVLEGLSEFIEQWMQEYKEGFLSEMGHHFGQDLIGHEPHIQNRFANYMIKNKFVIPKANLMTLDDELVNEENFEDVILQDMIDRYFHPLMIAKFIYGNIQHQCREKCEFISTALIPFEALAKDEISKSESKKRKEREFSTDESQPAFKKRKIDEPNQEMIDTYLRNQDWVRMDEMMIETEFTLKGVLEILNHLGFLTKKKS